MVKVFGKGVGEMIIREYEYELDRPWNCQERFIRIDGDNPWKTYLFELLNNPLSSIYMNRFKTERLGENDNAIAFYFEMNGSVFVHVAQDWTNHFGEEPIVVEIGVKK